MTDPAAKLERDLRALLPVLLADAHQRGEQPSATAERAVRVVLRCAHPLLRQPGDGAVIDQPAQATDDE